VLEAAGGRDFASVNEATIRDCQSRVVGSDRVRLGTDIRDFTVPVSGMLSLERMN
jgi:hypothetical protein